MSTGQFDRRAIPADAQVSRWAAPDGWRLRRFDWSPADDVSRRGSILFQGGRGDVFEKYLETMAHFRAAGWAITSFDWRGQGGSGRLTAAPHVGHVETYDDYVADLRAFHAEWGSETPGPHVVIGHSMGGHLVLRALAEGAIRADAAVLVAPMLGFRSPVGPLGERMARILGGMGDPSRAAWRGNERPHTVETRQALLTHDAGRYSDELWWQAQDPALLTGPPSWRWVIEGFRSMRALERDARLASLDVPLLMLVAERDGLVDARAALRIAAKLPDLTLVRFGKESAHEILREVDAVRDRALAAIDGFLAERAPAR